MTEQGIGRLFAQLDRMEAKIPKLEREVLHLAALYLVTHPSKGEVETDRDLLRTCDTLKG